MTLPASALYAAQALEALESAKTNVYGAEYDVTRAQVYATLAVATATKEASA